jgi:hypothetical protein
MYRLASTVSGGYQLLDGYAKDLSELLKIDQELSADGETKLRPSEIPEQFSEQQK